jgi:DNA primase large subunit
VEKGIVKLKKEEIARIVQEAIYERINEGLPIDVPGDICEAIKGHIEDIRKLLGEKKKKLELDSDFLFSRSTMSSITIDPSCFPPCISRILNNIKEGINVPHTARFAITAFLLNIGMKEEEVMAIYRKSLDFDEERTRYQVSHIAGSKGGVAYTAPSCATMRTYGNCEGKDEICEKISHPLSYYRLGLKQKQK